MKTEVVWKIFEKIGFFDAMKNNLQRAEKKNPKPSLDDYSYQAFVRHLREEVDELLQALDDPKHRGLLKELADVANMCGFLYAKRVHQTIKELAEVVEQ